MNVSDSSLSVELGLCRRTLERSEVTSDPSLPYSSQLDGDMPVTNSYSGENAQTEMFRLNAAADRSAMIGHIISPLNFGDGTSDIKYSVVGDYASSGHSQGTGSYDVDNVDRRCGGYLCFMRVRG